MTSLPFCCLPCSSELDEYEKNNPAPAEGEAIKIKNFQKTSLVTAIGVFDRFLQGCAMESRKEMEVSREETEMAASDTGDW